MTTDSSPASAPADPTVRTDEAGASSGPRTAWRRIEFILLLLVVLFLPLFESPKNIVLYSYFGVWFGSRLWFREFRLRKPDVFEVAIVGMVLASLVSTIVNWPLAMGTQGLRGTAVISTMFWCVYRGEYDESSRKFLTVGAIFGGFVALVWGLIEHQSDASRVLTLHSVGYVTTSAQYIVLLIAIVISQLRAPIKPSRRLLVLLCLMTTLSGLTVGLVLMGSRGAILGALLICALYVCVFPSWKLLLAVGAFVFLGVLSMTVLPDWFWQRRAVERTERLFQGELPESDQDRRAIWAASFVHLRYSGKLWLGVGPRNFRTVDTSHSEVPQRYRGKKWDHAHNLFLNVLVEDGVFGLFFFLLFWGALLRFLARDLWKRRARDWRWLAVAGILVGTITSGLVNTGFLREPAILAMCFFGLYAAWTNKMASGAP